MHNNFCPRPIPCAIAVWALCAMPAKAQEAGADPAQEARPKSVMVVESTELDAAGAMAPPAFGGFEFNRDFLRGFKNESALRNGARDYGYLGSYSLAYIEAVEVLKGPASALYGNGKPGGDLNTVTKLPGLRDYRSASLDVTTPGTRRVRGDLADVVGDGALRYRLIGQLSDGISFRDTFHKTSGVLAPTIDWRVTPDLHLMLSQESLYIRDTSDPLFVPNKALLALPAERFLGEPDNLELVYSNTTRLVLEYRVNPSARIRQAWFYQAAHDSHAGIVYDTYNTALEELVDGAGRVRRVTEHARSRQRLSASQTEWHQHGVLGGMSYDLLAGVEVGRFDYRYAVAIGAAAPIDIARPAYGAVQASTLEPVADQRYGTTNTVLYVQQRMAVSERSKALLGLRLEQYRDYYDDVRNPGPQLEQSTRLASPRLGWTYLLAPGLTGFVSWTNSSRPQIGARSANGTLFRQEAGTQVETGAQYAADDVLLTGSLFSIKKKNVLAQDPVSPNFQVASGERRSRGLELDATWHWSPQGKLEAAAAYTDAYVSRDTVLPAGTRLAGVPRWFGSAYLSYDLAGDWRGWGVGAGYVVESRRKVTLSDDDLALASFATVDLNLSYHVRQWSLDATLCNAGNKSGQTSDGFTVSPIAPRALQLSLRTRF
jgi:iron complex outermembrane receptor protein